MLLIGCFYIGVVSATSTEANPKVRYMNAGVYDATLIVRNNLGEDTKIFSSDVVVSDVAFPVDFEVSGGYRGQVVVFVLFA